MAKRFLVMVALLMLGFYVAGCAEGDESASVVNPNPEVFAPTGSISGVVVDVCAGAPIEGATVWVAYAGKQNKVVTGKGGAFSFNNVPANSGCDGYLVTCDLSTVKDNPFDDASYVKEVYVGYEDLGDGAGDDAATPVDKLAATTKFAVATKTNSVAGMVIDKTYGTDPLEGATVVLYDQENNFVSTGTTDASGNFTLAAVPANDPNDSSDLYKVRVIKSGYVYYDYASSGECSELSCSMLTLDCQVGCSPNIPVSAGALFVVQRVLKDDILPFVENIDLLVGDFAAANAFDYDEFYLDDEGDALPALVSSFGITFSEPMLAGHSSIYQGVELAASFVINVSTEGLNAVIEPNSAYYDVDYTLAWDATKTVLTLKPVITFDDDAIIGQAELQGPETGAWSDGDLTAPTITPVWGAYTITLADGCPTLALADENGAQWWYASYGSYFMSKLSGIQDFILGGDNYFMVLVGDEEYEYLP